MPAKCTYDDLVRISHAVMKVGPTHAPRRMAPRPPFLIFLYLKPCAVRPLLPMQGRTPAEQSLLVRRCMVRLTGSGAGTNFYRVLFPPTKWSEEINTAVAATCFKWLVGFHGRWRERALEATSAPSRTRASLTAAAVHPPRAGRRDRVPVRRCAAGHP